MDVSMLTLLLLGFSVVAALVTWIRWKAKRVGEAKNWPSTEATVQSAAMENVGSNRNPVDLPCFAFSYSVEGEYYSGRFSLSAKGDRADTLIKAMIDRKLIVQYDPKQPSSYFIPDEIIEDCDVGLVSD